MKAPKPAKKGSASSSPLRMLACRSSDGGTSGDRPARSARSSTAENLTERDLHQEVGLLRLNYTHLWLGQRLGTRMVTYTPADEETGARLRELSRRAAEARL